MDDRSISMRLAAGVAFALVAAVIGVNPAHAQQPGIAERVAGIKHELATSQAALKQYQWIETTTVSLKGEVKSTKQMRCYYGADGVLQKVEVSASPPPAMKPGLRGKIMANKKAELTDYMLSAVALVKAYVPPDPARIQAVKDAGKVTIAPQPGGKAAKLVFADYVKPGDSLGVNIDMAANRVAALTVATYLADPGDAVNLTVQMGKLNDGTGYPTTTTLAAPAKGLSVVVTNSGYLKNSTAGQ